MSKLNATFESVWKELEPKARALGAIDGDIDRVAIAARNLMITAGWASRDGTCDFVSDTDRATCLKATSEVVENTTKLVVAQRRVVHARPGFGVTKAQVLAGGARATISAQVASTVELTSTQIAANAFAPGFAKVGDRCPRCSGSMEPVGLVNERAGLYCPRDRVVLPLSADQSVRD